MKHTFLWNLYKRGQPILYFTIFAHRNKPSAIDTQQNIRFLKKVKLENLKAWTPKRNVANNKQKIANFPFSHYLYCPLLSSTERKRGWVNKIKIKTDCNGKHNSKRIIIHYTKHTSSRVCYVKIDIPFCIPLTRAH